MLRGRLRSLKDRYREEGETEEKETASLVKKKARKAKEVEVKKSPKSNRRQKRGTTKY